MLTGKALAAGEDRQAMKAGLVGKANGKRERAPVSVPTIAGTLIVRMVGTARSARLCPPYEVKPPGRANARPMTGSAKQSIVQHIGKQEWMASSPVLPCANASRLSQAMRLRRYVE